MTNTRSSYGVLVAAATFALLSTTLPASGTSVDDPADANAEVAGERAHFAQALCGVPAERIAGYKARLKKALHDSSDFDERWQLGWRRAENSVTQMSALRESNPAEFASRTRTSCARLKWQAKNALHPPSSH